MRGVWSLTQKGKDTQLDAETTSALFRDIQRQFAVVRKTKKAAPSPQDDELPQELESAEATDHREALLAVLRALQPAGFEQLRQRLLRESGFKQVTVTGRSGDGGVGRFAPKMSMCSRATTVSSTGDHPSHRAHGCD
jgi:restriction system protein